MERTTVSQMRSQLEFLEKEGHGDKFVGLGEYYVGEGFKTNDDTAGLWNEVYFDAVHYSEIELTKEQEEYIHKKTEEYTNSLPEDEKKILATLTKSLAQSTTPAAKKKDQIDKYIVYLNNLLAEGTINQDKYNEMMSTIR